MLDTNKGVISRCKQRIVVESRFLRNAKTDYIIITIKTAGRKER
jgi:hypothetical protein